MVAWTIQRKTAAGAWADPIDFTDIGIRSAVRKLVNQGIDTCALAFAGLRPAKIGGLKPGETIRVLRDGVGWFYGSVIAPSRSAQASTETATVTLQGPWFQLQQTVFQQVGLFYIVEASTDQGVTTSEVAQAIYSSQILLTQSDSVLPLDAGQCYSQAVQYCIGKGANITLGAVTIDQGIPGESLTDPTCADVIKKVLKWLPFVTCWFDYTQDPPVMNVADLSGRNPITLVMGGDAPQITKATLQARPDLVLPGVKLQFSRQLEKTTTLSTTDPVTGVTTPSGATTGAGTAYTGTIANPDGTTSNTTTATLSSLEIQTAGPNPEGIGAFVATVQLTGASILDNTASQTYEPTPAGLAQLIYDSRSSLTFEGTIALCGADIVSGENWIGRRVNISGGDDEWLSMAATVQGSTENTGNGQSTLTLGPPDHLGPSDLAALLRANRNRTYITPAQSVGRSGGGASLPPNYPPPPPPPNPPNQHGHGGPSNAAPGSTDHADGFAGLIYAWAGTASHTEQRGPAYSYDGGFHTTPPPLVAPPHSAPCTNTGSVVNGFYNVRHGSDYVEGNTVGGTWTGHNSNDESYSQGTLDLTGFSPYEFTYAELHGTYSRSKADGTTVTQDYQIPVTGYLGLRQPGFRVYCPAGGELQVSTYDGQSQAYAESLTITGLRTTQR